MRRSLRRPGGLLIAGALLAWLAGEAHSSSARADRTEHAPEKVRATPPRPLDAGERLAAPLAPEAWRCGASASPEPMGAGPPSFSLQFSDEVSSLPLVPTFVLPGQTLALQAVLAPRGGRFRAHAEAGTLITEGVGRWKWTLPERTGIYDLEVREASGGAVCLRAFVLVPYDGSEIFRHYRMGRYEATPLRGDPAYRVPRGLVEVTAGNRDTWLTPHFQLHQFECKQPGGDPHYLVLTTRLLAKLEALLEAFRDDGIDATTLFVMSGYRTPFYNRSIGNRTRYTRHAYGDAADVFVDEDRDGRMDDLDGDGDGDREDARRLYQIVERLSDETWYRPLVGGLALYGPAPHRGPFIHVDARGSRARW